MRECPREWTNGGHTEEKWSELRQPTRTHNLIHRDIKPQYLLASAGTAESSLRPRRRKEMNASKKYAKVHS
jgi:hypothetical protein